MQGGYKVGDILKIVDHIVTYQTVGRWMSEGRLKAYHLPSPVGSTRKGDRFVYHEDLVDYFQRHAEYFPKALARIGEDPVEPEAKPKARKR